MVIANTETTKYTYAGVHKFFRPTIDMIYILRRENIYFYFLPIIPLAIFIEPVDVPIPKKAFLFKESPKSTS